ALVDPGDDWTEPLTRLSYEDVWFALLERLEEGPTDARTVERLVVTLGTLKHEENEGWLLGMAGDELLGLAARGIAFEAWSQGANHFAQVRTLRRIEETRGFGHGEADLLESFFAGVALRLARPDAHRRLYQLLAFDRGAEAHLERLDVVRRALGVP